MREERGVRERGREGDEGCGREEGTERGRSGEEG